MTDPANAFKRLSAPEALRALYIDVEGRKDQPPVLLGVLRRDRADHLDDVVDVAPSPDAGSGTIGVRRALGRWMS